MGITDPLTALHGLPAFTFPHSDETVTLPEPDAVAWRITSYWDPPAYGLSRIEDLWETSFIRFCAAVDTTRVHALIIGAWGDADDTDPSEAIGLLLAVRDRFPALRAIFVGDITTEDCQIQSISQTDVTPLLAGFPALEELGVRAGEGSGYASAEDTALHFRLEFPALRHDGLRRLTVQSAGLRGAMVRGLGASELPALEHLELWLGMECYGGDSKIADLEAILSGTRLPRLRHLALRNSEIQDDVAAALASAPVVPQLKVIDLSLGELSDDGGAALLGGQPLTHLSKLDLHHNFLSEPTRQRIRETLEPAGVEVNLDPDGAEEWVDGNGTVHRGCAVFD
ncbi:STM4015 family protein [Streptomyces sp. NBC_00445]|uniref:STM4015 family protein n=1 Tax=Streptomyces sp. NBC_00445 TaxID=2975745 RepID=UPI002E22B875